MSCMKFPLGFKSNSLLKTSQPGCNFGNVFDVSLRKDALKTKPCPFKIIHSVQSFGKLQRYKFKKIYIIHTCACDPSRNSTHCSLRDRASISPDVVL